MILVHERIALCLDALVTALLLQKSVYPQEIRIQKASSLGQSRQGDHLPKGKIGMEYGIKGLTVVLDSILEMK
jgi:hypothetical protein